MTLTMRVNSVTWEIDLVHVYELRALGGGELPPFTAGAYVVVSCHGTGQASCSSKSSGCSHPQAKKVQT